MDIAEEKLARFSRIQKLKKQPRLNNVSSKGRVGPMKVSNSNKENFHFMNGTNNVTKDNFSNLHGMTSMTQESTLTYSLLDENLQPNGGNVNYNTTNKSSTTKRKADRIPLSPLNPDSSLNSCISQDVNSLSQSKRIRTPNPKYFSPESCFINTLNDSTIVSSIPSPHGSTSASHKGYNSRKNTHGKYSRKNTLQNKYIGVQRMDFDDVTDGLEHNFDNIEHFKSVLYETSECEPILDFGVPDFTCTKCSAELWSTNSKKPPIDLSLVKDLQDMDVNSLSQSKRIRTPNPKYFSPESCFINTLNDSTIVSSIPSPHGSTSASHKGYNSRKNTHGKYSRKNTLQNKYIGVQRMDFDDVTDGLEHNFDNIEHFKSVLYETSECEPILDFGVPDFTCTKCSAELWYEERIGSLLPEAGTSPKFAQLYVFDTDNEVQNRASNFRSTNSKKPPIDLSLVKDLQDMVYNCNPLAKAYRKVKDAIQSGNECKLSLRLYRNREKDSRMHNIPTADEVAEIRDVLHPKGLQPSDRPDIVCRVFKMKLDEMLSDFKKKERFGKVIAGMYTVEFQKRGLPHAHMLLWLDGQHKLNKAKDIDKVISAEIPHPDLYPKLHQAVASFMMHGPCGDANTDSPCMNADGILYNRRRELNLPDLQLTEDELKNLSISRVTTKKGLKMVILDEDDKPCTTTLNVVYPEIFDVL
ncbi:hypothetical protein P8452_16762 [Trifolium repens]|nr:hypothetical protein P8452_16762 [Trifolium repens]